MRTNYEIWLNDPEGNRLGMLSDWVSWFSWSRIVNGAGWFSVSLPGNFDHTLLRADDILEIWRAPKGGRLKRDFTGFVRLIDFETDANGIDYLHVSGPDINELIERRIVAYAASSAQAQQTDQVDDMLKVIARQNLGASATAARDLTEEGFSVAGDLADGPSITKAFSRRDVGRVFADLADAAAANGTNVYWEIVQTGDAAFQLVTYTGQPGQDHTYTSGASPVIFGLEWGNLELPRLSLDYSDEVNYIYAGGQGEGSDREIVEVSDATRIARSIWNRREGFADARNESTTAGVTAAANAALEAGKPRLRFSGNLLDTDQFVFGRDWDFGDRVTVTYRGYQLDGLVRSVRVDVNKRGEENIQARFEVEDAI